MSENFEIWNLSALCRCCHIKGEYTSLGSSSDSNDEETCSYLLSDTFGIQMSPPSIGASYSICDACIIKLREASQFKRQILICAEKFEEYCKNKQAQEVFLDNIKYEPDFMENDSSDTDTKVTLQELEITTELYDDKLVKTSPKIKSESNLNVQNEPPIIDNPSLGVTINSDNLLQSCQICKDTCKCGNQVKNHIFNRHCVYKCQICSIKCENKVEFIKHIKHFHEEKQAYKCPQCDKICSRKRKLLMHFKIHDAKCFICDICKKEFKSKSSIKVHILKHMGLNKVVICDVCGWKVNNLYALNLHKRTVHEKLRPYICNICNKSLSTKKSLMKHSTLHGEKVKYSCNICSKQFAGKDSLKQHNMRHENKFECRRCKNIYLDRSIYLSHIINHHKSNPQRVPPQNRRDEDIKCTECHKKFATRYTLRRHLSTHKVFEKFSCDICLSRFSQRSTLLRHIRRKHGTEKTTCDICKKLVCDINKHILRTHGDKVYKCDVCTKLFGDKDSLRQHKTQVHVTGQISCKMCDRKYKYKKGLLQHMARSHGCEKKDTDGVNSEA